MGDFDPQSLIFLVLFGLELLRFKPRDGFFAGSDVKFDTLDGDLILLKRGLASSTAA